MSHSIRSAKSGSDWTTSHLVAYNIVVQTQSCKTFFSKDLPATLADINPIFVNANYPDQAVNDVRSHQLLKTLDLAMNANAGMSFIQTILYSSSPSAYIGQKSSVDDFSRDLLHVLDYEQSENYSSASLRSRCVIPFHICGERTQVAQTNLCLICNKSTIILVIQEDKMKFSTKDLEPQVIAEAINYWRLWISPWMTRRKGLWTWWTCCMSELQYLLFANTALTPNPFTETCLTLFLPLAARQPSATR